MEETCTFRDLSKSSKFRSALNIPLSKAQLPRTSFCVLKAPLLLSCGKENAFPQTSKYYFDFLVSLLLPLILKLEGCCSDEFFIISPSKP